MAEMSFDLISKASPLVTTWNELVSSCALLSAWREFSAAELACGVPSVFRAVTVTPAGRPVMAGVAGLVAGVASLALFI